jgi:hypothetical protein
MGEEWTEHDLVRGLETNRVHTQYWPCKNPGEGLDLLSMGLWGMEGVFSDFRAELALLPEPMVNISPQFLLQWHVLVFSNLSWWEYLHYSNYQAPQPGLGFLRGREKGAIIEHLPTYLFLRGPRDSLTSKQMSPPYQAVCPISKKCRRWQFLKESFVCCFRFCLWGGIGQRGEIEWALIGFLNKRKRENTHR